MKVPILISHHNFVIANHLILLFEKYGISVYSKNITTNELDESISDLKSRIVIISRQNYCKYHQVEYGDNDFELCIILTDHYSPDRENFIFDTFLTLNTEVLKKIYHLSS